MYSIYSDYKNMELAKSLALVPVKSFSLNKKIVIRDITIYPEGTLKVEEIGGCSFDFSFEEVKECFFSSAIMAIPVDYVRPIFGVNFLPNQKRKFMNRVLETAEDIMNIMRFVFCNWDKTSNLPQRSGYIKDMTSGFLLCSLQMKSYSYICNKYVNQNYSLTNGLYVDVNYSSELIEKYSLAFMNESYEVASIIKHALRMYSDILYMHSSTNKFMQAMSLIEYLANPFEYVKMQDVKTKILPFSVDSRKKYHEACERFKYLTSLKDENDEQIGLRTCIVHNGKNLEQLIPESFEIDMLLRELQSYTFNFIDGILINSNCSWDKVVKTINEQYEKVQSIKSGYEGKLESDVAILIDMKFLNKAIKEVYLWYPQYSSVKFDLCKFLMLVSTQANIERKGYQIPVQLIFEDDEMLYNSTFSKTISNLEELGFDSEFGEYSIYTFDTSSLSSHSEILCKLLMGLIGDMNYNINPASKYNTIVFVSDRNGIPDEKFEKSTKSHKEIIFGRLDNKRTTNYDKITWFDIQLVIMTVLGIEYHEECVSTFIFDVNDGKYQGA